MNDLILHHYPESPFSEKIRLVFGLKKLHWKSVDIPWVAPKPDLTALTGGYRRTPVLQIGADVYCDTALICDVLEHVRGEPSLYPPHLRGACRIVAQWADSALFWAAMGYSTQPKGAAQVFTGRREGQAETFQNDRKAMGAGALRLRPGDATSSYRSYLRRLANMLDEHEFLFGSEPCLADFAAYHGPWFTRTQTPAVADILNATPSVVEWMDRMAAFGHGTHTELTPADAIAMAAAVDPRPPGENWLVDSAFQDDHRIPLGTRVTIVPADFGQEPTEGELIAATRTHYSLRREDPRAGRVHVHFPRIGYALRRAEAA